MVSEEHKKLTSMGCKYLKSHNFGVVIEELYCSGSRERTDVFGLRSTCSVVIEVKVSRNDFLADAKKPERQSGGLGNYRFYLCPEGLLQPSDMPPKWGLLYAVGNKVVEIVKPSGNMWPPLVRDPQVERYAEDWRLFQHESDIWAERSALYSFARKAKVKRPTQTAC